MAKIIRDLLEEKRIKLEKAAGSLEYHDRLKRKSNRSEEDREKYRKYLEKSSRADNYICELADVEEYVDYGLNVELVSKTMFDKLVEKSDFASIEYSGTYCQVAMIQSYPYNKTYIVYLAPMSAITS